MTPAQPGLGACRNEKADKYWLISEIGSGVEF